MDKQKFRFNHKTGKWDELFRINTDIVVMSGALRPDGTPVSFTIPRSSPLADHYLTLTHPK